MINKKLNILKDDWVECTLTDVCDIFAGVGFSKNKQGKRNGDFPFYKVGDISKNVKAGNRYLELCDNYIDKGDIPKYENKLLPPKSIVFAKIGEALKLNRRCITKKHCLVDNNAIGIRNNDTLEDLFLYFFFLTVRLEKYSRATTVPSVRKSDIENIIFYLPPLPIQRAIVNKIEELFSSLDSGIADLKHAQDQLKIYRQAVLKKAFEGEYSQKKMIEIADVNTGATPKRGNDDYWVKGTIPWVTSTVVNNDFVNEPSELITENAIKQTNCKIIPKGSLLVAMYGEGKTRGKCSELNINTATNQALAGITLSKENKESKQFVKWFFVKNYEQIRLLSSGGVQPNLNLSIIKNTVIPFPSTKEQHKIVRKIESRLSVCDKVEESIVESLEKAKALRQSILKKAFEGKLLSAAEIAKCKAEKDYQPANVLLARIKAEKATSAKNATVKKKK